MFIDCTNLALTFINNFLKTDSGLHRILQYKHYYKRMLEGTCYSKVSERMEREVAGKREPLLASEVDTELYFPVEHTPRNVTKKARANTG